MVWLNMKLTQLQDLLVGIVLEGEESGCLPIQEPTFHCLILKLRVLLRKQPRYYEPPLVFSGDVADALSALERKAWLVESYRSEAPGKTVRAFFPGDATRSRGDEVRARLREMGATRERLRDVLEQSSTVSSSDA